ncbi:MAG: TRAP transporter large permease [Firmicutes bacterium HGW-Firmicutes-12]|nr:MAG: TRAP transporter large permease [Firmicutes bacterium HGW-Firmicutes-12]
MVLIAIIFITSLLVGIPIAFVLGLTGLTHLIVIDEPLFFNIITQRLFGGVNSFSLMCIPFFIMAGDFMNKGGVTRKLIDFIREMIGCVKGGIAYVVVVVAMILSAILGSANAVAAMLCAVLVPEMKKDGYDDAFAGALIAASSVLGPVVPPSVTFIIYGMLTGVSVSKLFLAGIVPGVVIAAGYAGVIMFYSKKHNFPKVNDSLDLKRLLRSFIAAVPALVVPVIMLGGVLGGFFTPTESGAVAVAAAIIAGVLYRTLKWKDIPAILLNTGSVTAAIMLIIAFGNIMGWTLAMDKVPQLISDTILGITTNQHLVFAMILGFLILLGCVMEGFASLIIFAPVLAVLANGVNIDPVHFGVIICLMLTIGLITPPIGMLIFVVSNITNISLTRLSKAILPFAFVAFVLTVILAYIPDLVLFLPRVFGN